MTIKTPTPPQAEDSAQTLTGQKLAALLVILSIGSFLMSTSGISLSPFLQIIATDLNTSLPAVANLLSFMAISWAVASLVAGSASDYLGRRPILVGAVLIMGVGQLGLAFAQSYYIAVACQILAGLGGGAYMGTVYALVSDRVPNRQRGRALGWVIVGQSLALVFGVPLIALLGAVSGWRGALIIYAIVVLLAAVAIWASVPRDPADQSTQSRRRPTPWAEFKRPTVLLLLAAGVAERTCFASIAVYMATYLQVSYGVSLPGVALGLTLVAAGTVTGNMCGGQIADRSRARILIYAASALTTAAFALPLMLWQPGLGISVGLGFCYSFANALGRPALMAALSDGPAQSRGAVLGMNITASSFGWLTAAAVGGWLITHSGFGALGVLCAVAAIIGAILGFAHWRIHAGVDCQ